MPSCDRNFVTHNTDGLVAGQCLAARDDSAVSPPVMERVLAGEHDLTHARVGWGTGTGSTYLPVSIF